MEDSDRFEHQRSPAGVGAGMYSGSDGLCDATVKVAWVPQLSKDTRAAAHRISDALNR